METKTGRSELTLATIVDTALAMALAEGLNSLSLGEVAKRLGLSKSGVFSRVGSREALQKAVVDEFAKRFLQDVFVPAMREPRGLPRLNAIMQRWFRRADPAGKGEGCLYSAGAFELDDFEGPLRELLLEHLLYWRSALKRSVTQAIEAGHLRPDTDADQLVYELDSLCVGLVREARFLRDPRAPERCWIAYERLIRAMQA